MTDQNNIKKDDTKKEEKKASRAQAQQVTSYADLVKYGVLDEYDIRIIQLAEACLHQYDDETQNAPGELFLAYIGNIPTIKNRKSYRFAYEHYAVPDMFHAGVVAYLVNADLIGLLNTQVRSGLKEAIEEAIKKNVELVDSRRLSEENAKAVKALSDSANAKTKHAGARKIFFDYGLLAGAVKLKMSAEEKPKPKSCVLQ